MIISLLGHNYTGISYGLMIIFSFVICYLGIKLFKNMLPRDKGREFAVNGTLSEGKPRGAGIIFTLAFVISSVLFVPLDTELLFYLALIFIEMMSGYLDDSAKVPWGEYKKGLIDLAVSVATAYVYYYYNSSVINFSVLGIENVKIPAVLFVILGSILVWASINITNCTDGVDGLCGSVTAISLATALVMTSVLGKSSDFSLLTVIMIVTVLAYLWFNSYPSKLLMGDAGSRALGVMLAVAFLKTDSPFAFLLGAFVLIVDGGLGLIKIVAIRFFKLKNFMKNTRTPIHDHMRKNNDWSDTQVVFRFNIIQIVISLAIIALILR